MTSLIALEGIELQLYKDDEIRKLAVVQVTNASTYDRGLPKANGVNDPRMGVTDKALQCPTCGLTATCNNHFGFIELERPVLRLGHIASVLCILRSVCWACSKPKFAVDDSDESFVDVRPLVLKTQAGTKDRLRIIADACKNRFKCPWTNCGAPQPVYSRTNKVFLTRVFRQKEISLFKCEEERAYASQRLFPDEIQSIIHHIPYPALEILGYKPLISHPENYVFKAQLVPPPSIRPATSSASTEARMRGENDLTVALQDIVRANNELASMILFDDSLKITVAWDKLQIFCAALINENAKKLCTLNGTPVVHARAIGKRKAKVIKDRLTGKKGRLRGNLSGKRVDHAGRTVVGPDASHDIFQLGVPATIMRTLTFPEHVNILNRSSLAEAVVRGAGARFGALTIRQSVQGADEKVLHLSLLDEKGRRALAADLQPGWTVERHLRDGDWVLFNRQPSLHKASIMAFRAYETQGLQFKLPLPCTKPFNADFDGDEMNIHALQDYCAIAEAQEIMSVPNQMVTPQNNSVLIALVQDSIVGAYIMSRMDAFVNRERAMHLAMCIHYATSDAGYSEMPIGKTLDFADTVSSRGGFPEPAILKGTINGKIQEPMWTGKQIFSWMLPISLSLVKGVNGGDANNVVDICDEKVVIVRHGQLLAGRLCKQSVGNTSSGIVHELWKNTGPWAAAKFVSDAQRILMEWIRMDTVCISIRDCLTPCDNLVDEITSQAMGKVAALEAADVPSAVKEVRQMQVLQETLRTVGATVLENMDVNSGIATVVTSGAKGNLMNIAQIAGVVGQQTVNGTRIGFRKGPNGPRTLANFAPGDNSPEARGFVASSYMMGLQPSEFFFHQQAGREGVVAIAVSTADTGYNQRRMIKNQESEVVSYDLSVRVSRNLIVQQHYGGDDYDGSMVERVKLPVIDRADASSLICEKTSKKEREWIKKAHNQLQVIKDGYAVYGLQRSCEVAMPANFSRLVASIKTTTGSKIANSQRILKKLLRVILSAHHGDILLSESIEDLIFWPTREWQSTDDPSIQARLALTLQCTTKAIHDAQLVESDEDLLIKTFTRLYIRGIVNAGEGVGAVGSSSIGEPSTQMTLNIFHYSGIAEKNVTLTGLPRFKQIINAVDTFDTSNMRIAFNEGTLGSQDEERFSASARASRLASTSLSIVTSSSRVCKLDDSTLDMRLALLTSKTNTKNRDRSNPLPKKVADRVNSAIKSTSAKKGDSSRLSSFVIIFELNKESMLSRKLSIDDVGKSLRDFMGSDAVVTWSAKWCSSWTIVIIPPTWGKDDQDDVDDIVANAVHDALLEHAVVNGVSAIKKAVPEKIANKWIIETEGSDILEVGQSSPDIDLLKTTTNNIQEVARILGVEAALCLMQSELHRVLSFDGSYVDPRHTWLLSDTVARSGIINPLNRHKMEELGGSLLQCASFEQTLDVFEHGAAFGKSDSLGGATEKLIVGQPVYVGTGSFTILSNEEEPVQSSFVAPLEKDHNEFESRVTPMTKQVVKSNTILDRVLPIQAKQKFEFRAPTDLPSDEYLHTTLTRALTSLVSIMRRHAQNRIPVWINAEIIPGDGDLITKTEFRDIENALESYNGWTRCPQMKHFSQFSEVEYDVDGVLLMSRVEYALPSIRSQHRRRTVLSSIDCAAPDPYDAWLVRGTAITYDEISVDQLPLAVTPHEVKIVQEKSFSKGCWVIRLSRTWTGKNIVEAEESQRGGSSTCVFSINIELEKPWDILETRGSSDISISGGFSQRVLYCLQSIE
jgi:DNA-directed RNA polymerase II subunit RPB1